MNFIYCFARPARYFERAQFKILSLKPFSSFSPCMLLISSLRTCSVPILATAKEQKDAS